MGGAPVGPSGELEPEIPPLDSALMLFLSSDASIVIRTCDRFASWDEL